jgi:polysaccharide deacetylase family protein (PEP-CTERM system associated)
MMSRAARHRTLAPRGQCKLLNVSRVTTIARPVGGAEIAVRPAAVTSWNCLSVDVEEYFHCEVFAGAVRPQHWPQFERRAESRLELIAELLARYRSRATFFVLGWLAPYVQSVLRELAARGHEIACHGYGHQHLARMTPRALAEDLRRAKDVIGDCIGVQPRGYRAPTFSVTARTAWALDVIAAAGFEYDASIFPVRHDRYGVPDAPPGPFRVVGPDGARLLEFPPLTVQCGGCRIPLGGGGYMRLWPGCLMRRAVRQSAAQGRPVMLYLHPWELDPEQPELPAGRLSRWRHRVNLHTTAGKLEALLKSFKFDTAGGILRDYASQCELPEYSFVSARPCERRAELVYCLRDDCS